MESIESPRRKPGRPPAFDREHALDAAMRLFWQHGFEATSLAQLTQAMGINAPSLYAAFGDKKRLFVEVARRYTGEPEQFSTLLVSAPTARAGVQALVEAAAERFTGESTPRGCLLASAAAAVGPSADELRAMTAAIREDTRRRIAERIGADVAAGLLPAGTNVALLATAALGAIQAMAVLARDGADRRDLVAMAEFMLAGWPAKHRTQR
ncbi:MAG: TetR/AcrR family transcriptional regulator [Silanimonas sp.]